MAQVVSLLYENTLFTFLFHLEGKLPRKTALKLQQYYPIENKFTYPSPQVVNSGQNNNFQYHK